MRNFWLKFETLQFYSGDSEISEMFFANHANFKHSQLNAFAFRKVRQYYKRIGVVLHRVVLPKKMKLLLSSHSDINFGKFFREEPVLQNSTATFESNFLTFKLKRK